MNTHDKYELPPLPPGYVSYEFHDGGYDADEMRAYARAAIKPYAKRIAELEAARIAYASEFAPDEDGEPDVGRIHENIRKLKEDRKRRGEVVVTKTPEGEIIAVTRQDNEGKILSVIAEADRQRRGDPVKLCDCERGHNGMGMAGRECDCPGNNPQPIE